MKKAVFLDRDGVINDGTRYYTYRVADFVLNPGVAEGLKLLQDAGYILVVVTNQSGVAKGEYTERDVATVHDFMRNELGKQGVIIQKVYHCPHHPDVMECDCRKPRPGMLERAIEELDIDRKHSFMIGDSKRDVEAALKAGVYPIKTSKNENIVPWCEKIANGTIFSL